MSKPDNIKDRPKLTPTIASLDSIEKSVEKSRHKKAFQEDKKLTKADYKDV
ncbi:hypothetical protein [Hahella ganghwensis]|uniref:hypothetical protein n=1 Tax=Hahella ganghwensis TaxID=286420 RepID=UPI00036339F8|nr:hypothetical protein [Hahella ganghwensis]